MSACLRMRIGNVSALESVENRGSGSLVLLAGASVRSSGYGGLGRLLLGTVGQVDDAVVVGLGGDERELEVKPVVEQAGSVTQRQRVHEEV
jgi:hypothetical protein